jgi:hypothetical protein
MKRAFSFHPQFRSGLKEIYKPYRNFEEKNNGYVVFELNIHHAQFPNLSSDISFNDDVTSILLLGVSLMDAVGV